MSKGEDKKKPAGKVCYNERFQAVKNSFCRYSYASEFASEITPAFCGPGNVQTLD